MNNVTSYCAYADQNADLPENQSARPVIRANVGVSKVTSNGGVMEIQSAAPVQINGAEINPYYGTDSFAATARNPNGLPVTQILPSTLVRIDGLQAPVSFFVDEGMLALQADGTYIQTEPNQAPAPADASDYLPIDDAGMASINDALAPLEQKSLDGVAAFAVGVAIGTLSMDALANRFTVETGCDPAEGTRRIGAAAAVYQAQADTALMTRNGIDREDLPAFYLWARQHHREALQHAIHHQLYRHDVSGYKHLADKWASATPPSVAALKAAGVPVRTTQGVAEAFIQGQWMTPAAAARAGVV